jgi:hypothetical protein
MPKMVQSAGPHLLVVAVAGAMLTVGCGKGNLLEVVYRTFEHCQLQRAAQRRRR